MGKSTLHGTPMYSQIIHAVNNGRRFRVCIDGKTIELFDTEKKAKAFLKGIKLHVGENGYIDKLDPEGNHLQSLYQKLTTSGPLLECF